MVAQFAQHHPVLYSRLLMAALVVTVATGLHSAVVAQAKRITFVPAIQPPVSRQISSPVAQTVRPKGWEQVSRLPGTSGSGDAAHTARVRNAARPVRQVQSTPPITIPTGSATAMAIGRDMNAAVFGEAHWPALQALWTRESNWNPNARNRSSGACGIPQALPCSKIPDMSTEGQIRWGLSYIQQRYGNPTNAYSFWRSHNWY